MTSTKTTRVIFIIALLALSIGADQVTKVLVRNHMDYFDEYSYLDHHVTIRRVDNTGAFLSLGDSLSGPLRYILLNILPFIAVLFGLYYVFFRPGLNRTNLIAIVLIIAGGLGNLYDRVRFGSVTDFMHIKFFGAVETGVFNVADMCIMAGTFMIILHAWFKKKPEEENPGKTAVSKQQVP
jgi:signal peptidase II